MSSLNFWGDSDVIFPVYSFKIPYGLFFNNRKFIKEKKLFDCFFINGIFNTTYLNSADVSPGMEMVPKSSVDMIRSGHGNTETSPLCLQMHVSYGMDTEIQA